MAFLSSLLARVGEYRRSLSNPGRCEDIHRKTQNVMVGQSAFDGAKFELYKSVNDGLQLQHTFTMGSKATPSAYNFGSVFYKNGTLMHGIIDGSGAAICRLILPIVASKPDAGMGATPTERLQIDNSAASGEGSSHAYASDHDYLNSGASSALTPLSPPLPPVLTLHGRAQVGGQHDMFQIELENNSRDYNATFAAVNPSPLDVSGIYTASYMQAVSPRLALGLSVVHQRRPPPKSAAGGNGGYGGAANGGHEFDLLSSMHPGAGGAASDTSFSVHARLRMPRFALPKPDLASSGFTSEEEMQLMLPETAAADPLACLSLHSMGMMQASYYLPVSKKTELAAELNVAAGQRLREGVASVGVKYDFTQSSFRTMIDTFGKVTSLLETRITPSMTLQISGELDHLAGDSRFGIGLQLEV